MCFHVAYQQRKRDRRSYSGIDVYKRQVINFTKYWNDSFVGTSIRYRKGNVCAVTDYYTAALHAALGNEDATIINLSINDASIQTVSYTHRDVYKRQLQDKAADRGAAGKAEADHG